MTTNIQYPIGQFIEPETIGSALINTAIDEIDSFPARLLKEVELLEDFQLDTPYRPGGWTIRQVVHHCADSHMNSLIRFKLALTEDKPVIKPYFEDRWANLPDSKLEIQSSILLLNAIHIKWVILLKTLTEADLQRSYIHPDNEKEYSLALALILYAWHCKHHLAHITTLKFDKG